MIAILNSFDEYGFNKEIFIQELIKWYKRDPIGIGSTSKKAIQKLIEGDRSGVDSRTVITSYSIHYTKLYDIL